MRRAAASVLGATTGSQHERVEAGSGLLLRLASRAAACGMGCGGLWGSRASSPTSRSPPPRPPHHRPAASEISQRPEPMSALCSYAVIFLINLHLMPLNFSASLLWCAGPPPLPLSATTWVHAHAGSMWATYQAGCSGRSCPCGQCSILPGRQRRVVSSQADYGGSYTGASPPPSW